MENINTTKAVSHDLDALLSPEADKVTFKVPVIVDADGNPESGFIIVGRNSPEFREADKAVRIVNQKAAASRTKAIDLKTDAGATKVVDIVDGQDVARAAAVVVDWFGWDKAGVPRPFDKSAMPKILAAKPTWLAKINAALTEDNNFLPVSPSSSEPSPSNS
jgi:hypothetical protein